MQRQVRANGQNTGTADNQKPKEIVMKKQTAMLALATSAILGVLFATGCATTPRQEPKIYEPAFLTPHLRQQNLLGNASFEDTNSLAWVFGAYKHNPNGGRYVQVASQDGKPGTCVEIDNEEANVTWFTQTVRVKPKTKYLFTGWAKIENVTKRETGSTGAILSTDNFETSPTMLLGSRDWTYLSYVFDSGDRTVINARVQLGNWTSAVTGKAWFDDVCLIELPNP